MDVDKVGSIIVVRHKGRMYDHYGILDGHGGCIHVNKRKGIITIDPLDKVLRNARKVSYLQDDFDTRWRNYEHAKALIGSSHKYKFLTQNCETFVNHIRTGRMYSRQVDQVCNLAALAILAYTGIKALSLG